jgi:hypothetical protein
VPARQLCSRRVPSQDAPIWTETDVRNMSFDGMTDWASGIIQLDVNGSVGLNGAASDYRLGVGFSCRP